MKILHIAHNFFPNTGGIESFTGALISALQARGHQNRVVASHTAQPIPDQTFLGDISIQRVPFLPALTHRDPLGILHSKKSLARVKQEFAADVIHLHLGGPIAALYLMTQAVAPAPLVVTVYDFIPHGQDSESLRAALESASQIVAISQARLDECLQFFPQAASRMQRIYVSMPHQNLDFVTLLSPTPLFLMAGRQVAEKGFDLALESFSQVVGRFPTARLVLVGDGPVHAQLEQKIRQMRLQDAVLLPGRLPDQELARLYRQAWVTLVPSLHSESFGLVALEAMQAACPVIASRVGGLPEVVLEDETGLLFPAGDVQALTGALLRVLENPVWARQLGQAGKIRAHELFDWETCVDSYETLYQSVLA